jgi:hypothetical protein
MSPQGYADGLLKPANQVRAQKNLVKSLPGSNLPKQPSKVKRVKQSVPQMLEEKQTKLQQQSYLPPSGSVGPIREIQQMKGLSGVHREIDMDKHMQAREQIQKITEQQGKLHRGRNVSDAMREAEELGNQYRHSPQWQQDLSREQVNKRRHALSELVRTNRDPRQDVDSHFPPNIRRPLPPEQLAAAGMRGADPARYAPGRRQAPQISLATPRVRSVPPPSRAASRSARARPASARAPSSTVANSSQESHRRLQRRLHRRVTGGTGV